ncbi:DUF2141 domain-containing protein [Maricaulaceae bacterium MS644]
MQTLIQSALTAAIAAAGLIAFTPAPAIHAAGLVAQAAETALESDMRVRITGLESSDGQVLISVFASEAAYDAGDAVAEASVAANRNGVAATFDALPAGAYAVIAFHDANSNAELDSNFMGMPTERYGFSNGAAPRFRRARFDEAAFTHPGDATVTVTLMGAGQ